MTKNDLAPSYQHDLARRLWEAQCDELPADAKRLLAEAATEIERRLPAAPTLHYHQNCATCTCREPAEIRDPYRPQNTADV